MFENPPQYFTYILRFWEERAEGGYNIHWRFTLEDPANNVRHGFDSLDELTSYLQAQMGDHPPLSPPEQT